MLRGKFGRLGGWVTITAGALFALVGAACDSGSGDETTTATGSSSGGPSSDVTFHKDIEPILHKTCLGCHRVDQIAGFSLESYEDAKAMSGLMAAQVEARLMPPFHAADTDQCKPTHGFLDDPRLSDDEVALFRAWDDAGAPEGDPADAPPAYVPEDQQLPDTDLEMTPASGETVDGDDDIFQCVVYDPALTEDKWLDGINIVPGNRKVAHHALLFRVSRADAAAASGGQERFDCFGAPGADLIGAWAPGAKPLELPTDVGMQLTTDDVIVVQMHYHPTGDTSEVDKSSIQLRYIDATPKWSFQFALLGNASSASEGLLADPDDRGEPEFRIPAGAKSHTEDMEFTIPETGIEVPVLLVGTHMHYVGYDGRFSVTRANPGPSELADECFVETPAWDFNWQRGYMYDAPISDLPTISTGDVVHMHCEYNNTMGNRFVQQALEQQGLSAPQDVSLGETTLDEMCLGVLGYLLPN
ncbi:MAG TPA: hypothetical protein VL400_23770 [Polyangiaceae bacterium]|jgi:hypothetical protein|nr:hypothetical protein [Polyangiaceae bacterium]